MLCNTHLTYDNQIDNQINTTIVAHHRSSCETRKVLLGVPRVGHANTDENLTSEFNAFVSYSFAKTTPGVACIALLFFYIDRSATVEPTCLISVSRD